MDSGATASGETKKEEQKVGNADQYKSYLQQGIDEQRYMVPTKNGIIDEVIVQKYKEAHLEAVKEQNAEGATKQGDEDKQPTVNAITSNQTQEYFAIATETGFEILQNDSGSTRLKKKVQDLNKQIALVEMMYKTNVIVLVYEQQRNKVVIWDDHEKKNRTEITFNANQLIMNVKLRKDMMIVVLNEKAFIFNFVTLKLIEQVDTYPNPCGLCALSQAEKPISKIICLPHQDKGSLKVLNYVVDKSIDLVIPAHDTEVGAIAVNPDGTLIASASERGHIIKIYSTDAGEVVQELKRGNSKAYIENILFHPQQYILACTSSKQSIHIFEITKAVEKCIQTRQFGFSNGDLQKKVEAKNTKSGLQFMKVLNKYWESDLCLAKIKVNEKMKTIGFDFKNNRLAIVTHERTIYFVDIPKEQTRYIEEAECRFY